MSSLRNKLWLGFGGLLLILLAVSTLTLVVFTRYSHALERVFSENYNSAVWCDAIKQSLDELDARAQRLIWENGVDAPSPTAAVNRLETSLKLELKNCSLPGEIERAEQLATLWEKYKADYLRFDTSRADRRTIYSQQLLPLNRELKLAAQQVSTMNMSNMVAVDGQAKRTLIGVRNALLALVSVGTLLAGVLVGTVGAALKRPLGLLTESAKQIAGGDLNLNVGVTSTDEIGQLAAAFNVMAARLREFRKVDHERLARTQQTTQLAIDSLPDAVFVIDPGGVIEISNRTAQTHFDIRPGRAVGELDIAWLTELFAQVSRDLLPIDPQGYRSAVQLFEAGLERFLLPRAVPMLDAQNGLLGVTVILVDVTRLRQIDEVKSGMVSTVSHELRTPLTSVRMAVSLMLTGKVGAVTPQQQKLLKAADDDVERLRGIIENLLSMTRIEAGRARFDIRATPVRPIVEQATSPLANALLDSQVKLVINVADDVPAVQADVAAVATALGNVLSNAIKFSPTGGEVRLGVAAAVDGGVAFAVTDAGPGIPPQWADRVFERFFRVPSPDGPTGAGLGLAIAKEIVDAHHGSISVAVHNGCTFTITIPAAT